MKTPFIPINARSLYQLFIHIAVLVLIAEVIFLANQNKQCRENKTVSSPTLLKKGDLFSYSELKLIRGEHVIDTTSNQLIYAFTTSCPFCKKSVEGWNKLSLLMMKERVSVFGISLDPEETILSHLTDHPLNYPIYAIKDKDHFKNANHVTSVPQTILCNREGRVVDVWSGLFSDDKIPEVVRAISSNK